MITGIDHITINLKDKAASLRFYGELLHLERLPDIKMDDHRLIFFSLPGGSKLELIEYDFSTSVADFEQFSKGKWRHIAFKVSDLDQLAAKIIEYDGKVIQPPQWVERLGFKGMLIIDPNGCELELIEYAKP